jgi:hypothetical protein
MSSLSVLSATENNARTQFRLSFELSPIILTGGVAQNVQGGQIPIISFLQGNSNSNSIYGNLPSLLNVDGAFAHFQVLPGGSIIEQEIAKYPMANLYIAANATINEGLHISVKMICPSKGAFSVSSRQTILTALQQTLTIHNANGGSYNVATPSFLYTGCLLEKITDITSGESKQSQVEWQFDFYQPLLTLAQALQAQNEMMSKISNGLPTDGSLTGSAGGGASGLNLQAASVSSSGQVVQNSTLPPPPGAGGGTVPLAQEGMVKTNFSINSAANITSSSGTIASVPTQQQSVTQPVGGIFTNQQANNSLAPNTAYTQVSYTSGASIPNYTSATVTNSQNTNFYSPIPGVL